MGVWARAALVAVLAAAMTQWPYATCGRGLAFYLAATGVVLVAAVWAAYASWRRRMGVAHIAAIVLVFSGLALGAYHVLPRLGYGPVEATWRCIG